MNLHDVKLRIRALIAPRRVEQELDEELRLHIEFETQKHIDRGQSPADARARALARFGSPALAADECRDARGTAFIDNSVRDVLYAFRTFRRAPLAAVTIVATVALGLGLVAVVFTFYSALFLRVDAVRNPEELFEVRRPDAPGNTRTWVTFVRRDYDALLRDTSTLAGAVAMLPDVITRVDGRAMNGTLVTGNFFEVLGTGAALGRTLSPDDDARHAGRRVMVLSYRAWSRVFGADRNAVGRSVLVNGAAFEVIGVMPPDFRGLTVMPSDFWAPLDLIDQFRPALAGKEDEMRIDIVGRLKPGMSPAAAMAELSAWAAGNPEMKAQSNRPKTIFLRPRQGTASRDMLAGFRQFSPLFFAFGLILLIACANVANLLLARGVARQREIGVRLTLGASRGRIVRQLLTESLSLALAAALCGFGVLLFTLEAATRAAVLTAQPALAELIGLAAYAIDWRVALFLLGGAVASTIFFGSAPALQATRLELVRTMRGEITRDARPGRARHALIAVQVTASALLLICAAVFLRSALVAANEVPGLRTTDTLWLEMSNESTRAAMLQAVAADPAVAATAASWPHGVGGNLAEARGAVGGPVEYKFVSPEYFGLFDIALVKGRRFTPGERSPSAGVAVVSETAARRLWPDDEAVGQRLEFDGYQRRSPPRLDAPAVSPELPFRAFTVVGVVRDARIGRGIHEQVDAGVYVPIGAEAAGTSLALRGRGDPDLVREQLIERLTKVDPAMGGITTMRTIAGVAVYMLQVAFWITGILGALALTLTMTGLFSVLSYVVAQQAKEIGVRMALGASTRDIARLVLSQSSRPVAAGLVLGGLLAGSGATALLATPVAAGISEVVRIRDPLAYGASLLCILMACLLAASIPALRAARIDPMSTLKQD
jgi:predicted permease